MRHPARSILALSAFALLGVQLACGSDPSGPGDGAASITANSSTTLTAAPGSPVFELPSVVVRDQSGAPLPGAHVTFTVTSGGGTISGGSATTDASGIATVGSWTLGSNPGTNTLTARSGTLPVVTFTADGADPCTVATIHVLGSSTDGQLSPTDCTLPDGSFVDLYAVTIPTAGTYVFTQTSTEFDSYILLLAQSGALVGVNDDSSTTNTNSLLKVLVPAGNYLIGANSYMLGERGRYTLTSAVSAAHVTNCEDAFVLVGITSSQSLQASDCNAAGSYSDDYVILLSAGQIVHVTMGSGNLDSFLEIHADGNATVLQSNDDIDTSTKDARLDFTAPVSDFYIVKAKSTTVGVTGPYTLAIQ